MARIKSWLQFLIKPLIMELKRKKLNEEKNKKFVKTTAWILIVGSVLVLLGRLAVTQGYRAMIEMQLLTKNFDPPFSMNFTIYYIQCAIEIILCIIIFVSSTYILQYKEKFLQLLIYSLIAAIAYLLFYPLFNYFNFPELTMRYDDGTGTKFMKIAKSSMLFWEYLWSIILSAGLFFVIHKLSEEEVKSLFK